MNNKYEWKTKTSFWCREYNKKSRWSSSISTVYQQCLLSLVIKQSFEDAQKYDSFFLHKKDGKVNELWGVLDRYPYSTTYAYRIIQTCK